MLTLAAELHAEYAMSLVCPPSPSGDRLLARAQEMGLNTLPLEARGEREAGEQLSQWLRDQQVRIFHGHAGVAWEGHDGIRAAHSADVPRIVRTEHLPDLTVVFGTEELPDLVYSPYHLPDRRPGLHELIAMVGRHRADHLQLTGLVDRVICVSQAASDTFVKSGVPPDKLRVVRNGIRSRPPSSSRPEARERLGIPSHIGVVLTIARMIDVKGHFHLLEAVPGVVRRHPNAKFIWVGGGPLEDELRERVQLLGLDDWVHLAGQRNDVPDLMAAADLFVLPSLVEGLPLVVLEAMAAGLPVVGTRAPGTSEVIIDGVTGRLVPPGHLAGSGDVSALVDAILEPLQDPDLAARWGAAGQDLVEREFSAKRMARETADVYDELLY